MGGKCRAVSLQFLAEESREARRRRRLFGRWLYVAAAERLLAPLMWGAVPASLFTSISGAARLRLLGYRPFWNQHISCLWLTRCAVVPLPPRSCQHLTCSRERGEKKNTRQAKQPSAPHRPVPPPGRRTYCPRVQESRSPLLIDNFARIVDR